MLVGPMPRRRMNVRTYLLRGGVVAGFLGFGALVLAWSHPHEDAYILFTYARQLADGQGVVYFPGGPRSEGATDFLWMVVLAGLGVLGVPPPVAALLLGAIGLAFVGRWVLPRAIRSRSILAVGAASLLVSPASVAGAFGFGTTAFSALALLGWLLLWRGPASRAAWTPALAVVLGLVRPDGLVLGAGIAVLGAVRARRAGAGGRWVAVGAASTLVGLGYFAWRVRYFDAILPLPLIVKSHGVGLEGLRGLADWALETLLPYGGVVVLCAWIAPRVRRGLPAPALALAPFALHQVAFSFGAPLQNAAARFYAPASLVLLGLAVWAVHLARRTPGRRWVGVVALALAACPGADHMRRETYRMLHHYDAYLTALSAALVSFPSDVRVLSTEAGRVGYFARGPVYDPVGLNTPEAARVAPTPAELDAFAPDLVVAHPAGVLDAARLGGGEVALVQLRVPLASGLRPWCVPVDLRVPYGKSHLRNIDGATLALVGWLDARRDAYDVYLAPTDPAVGNTSAHVVALRRSSPHANALRLALEASTRAKPNSYFFGPTW